MAEATIYPQAREGARVTWAAEPSRSNLDVPVSRVHRHATDGVFYVVTCTCSWASREFTDPLDGGVDAEYAKALHDMAHRDEWEASS